MTDWGKITPQQAEAWKLSSERQEKMAEFLARRFASSPSTAAQEMKKAVSSLGSSSPPNDTQTH